MIHSKIRCTIYFNKPLRIILAGLLWFGGAILVTSTSSAQEEVMSFGYVCAQKFTPTYITNGASSVVTLLSVIARRC